MAPTVIELPGALRLAPSFPFVGRALERATLRALLPRAAGEGRRVALVAGEAGSGKSRLVREHAREGFAAGAVVLYGSCDMTLGSPYQPFVEALSHLFREADPVWLRARLGSAGRELVRLLPDLGERVGELPPPLPADPDTERHRLHVAVTDLLDSVSRSAPLLLVVEDVHWADPSTLQLLRHLVRAGTHSQVLLVVTFRDDEQETSREFAETLADLARAEGVARLRLGGLSGEEVIELVRTAAGDGRTEEQEAATVATWITGLTRGNPFLVGELWRALVETGTVALEPDGVRIMRPLDQLATPESVREVAVQRLARLEAATRTLLELAAVLGPEFELRLLDRAAAFEKPQLQAALEEGARSGMIQEVPPFGVAYRFTHELVRRALVDTCTAVHRAELHLRAGRALETLHPDPPTGVLSELAHHFASAASLDDADRAVDYSLRAGRAAMTSLAYEEAAERFQTALALGVDDPRTRASVELELGTGLNWAGRTLDAIHCFKKAAELARQTGDGKLFAQAAIGLEETCWRPGITDQGTDELLREALTALPDDQPELRVRLLGGLGRALRLLGRHDEAGALRAQALELAREAGDERAIANVLTQAYWAPGDATADEILAMLAEARQIGEQLGDITIRAEAMGWRVVTLVSVGDLAAARKELAVLRSAAERMRQPFLHHAAETFGSALALCEGRLTDAEEMAQRGWEWGRLMHGPDPSGAYGLQLFNVRREQGRLAELAPIVRLLAEGGEPLNAWQPGLIALLTELGMTDQAHTKLRTFCARDLSKTATDALGIAALAYLADTSAALGEAETAALLYPKLAPLAGRPLLVGHLVACFGSADRLLGKLAATLGDRALAARHFEAALTLDRRMGATLWLAHTRYEYARMLHDEAGVEERARADQLLALAAETTASHDMRALAAKIQRLAPPAAKLPHLPDDLSPREIVVLRLVAHGLSNREIGSKLAISQHTVANHIRSILRKTRCANRTEATAYVYQHGLAAAAEVEEARSE